MLKIKEENRKWWVLVALSLTLSLVFIDQTAISVSLPTIQKQLGLSNLSLQWIVNAYLLVLSSLLILGGRAGDLFGQRRVYITGVIIFTLASIFCGMATSGWWIILNRALQGVGGALMMPTIGVLLMFAFPENERGRAAGYTVSIASIFLSLGPLMGGFFTQYASWRWVFWVNAPIAIISILLTLLVVPKPAIREKRNIDWRGGIVMAVTIASFITALMQVVDWGWHSFSILALFTLTMIGCILLPMVERRRKNPLIDFSLFANKSFTSSVLVLLFIQAAFIVFVFWGIFLQNILSFSPGEAGLLILPVTLPVMFMAPIGGRLRDKYGARMPVSLGTALATVGAIWIALMAGKQDYYWLLPGFLFFGFGIPLVIAPCYTTALTTVSESVRGMASGISGCVRQLGGSMGLALLTSVMVSVDRHQFFQSLRHAKLGLSLSQMRHLQGLKSGSTLAKQTLAKLAPDKAHLIGQLAANSYTHAFATAMVVVAILALISFSIARLLPRNHSV